MPLCAAGGRRPRLAEFGSHGPFRHSHIADRASEEDFELRRWQGPGPRRLIVVPTGLCGEGTPHPELAEPFQGW